ncbi:hypothetical protein C8Q73DRAFT_453389 [Cubamyces lactineus]|nr:hypothetical protein C8Q73DRAFT_453389 [Cubamyces lactineus]
MPIFACSWLAWKLPIGLSPASWRPPGLRSMKTRISSTLLSNLRSKCRTAMCIAPRCHPLHPPPLNLLPDWHRAKMDNAPSTRRPQAALRVLSA